MSLSPSIYPSVYLYVKFVAVLVQHLQREPQTVTEIFESSLPPPGRCPVREGRQCLCVEKAMVIASSRAPEGSAQIGHLHSVVSRVRSPGLSPMAL